jgi:two-component system sensor histidine kinase DesK
MAPGQGRGLPGGRGLLRGGTSNGATPRVLRGLAASVWLVYLASPLSSLLKQGHSAVYDDGAVALTAVFAAIYLWLIVAFTGPPRGAGPAESRRGARWAEPAFAVLFAIAVASSVIYGSAGIVMWIFVASAAGWGIRGQRRALRVLGLTISCYLVLGVTSHLSSRDFLVVLLPLVLSGSLGIVFRRRIELTRQLTTAREEIERMAAAQERLRLARDMHDLTGQSLSMITLKSELAVRLLGRLPEGPDRDRARDEIEQVAAVSRQTLHDIRQAVSGYRRPTLAVEAITARGALESAGITCRDDPELTLASGTFDPDAEAALAWCLREAVTNVIRHSGAGNCCLSLTRHSRTIVLKVRDDGHGYEPAAGDASTSPGTSEPAARDASTRSDASTGANPGASPGTGLRGMSERLSGVGGTLELRPAVTGFALVATVPAGDRSGRSADRVTLTS